MTDVVIQTPGTNVFDLSHPVLTTMNFGELTPTLVQQCVPGDVFDIDVMTFMRMAPMLAPQLTDMNVTTHFYFVPNRILWPKWKDYITGELDTPAALPTVDLTPALTTEVKRFFKQFGLPEVAMNRTVSAFPMAAYQFIYNEYYRDQNLISEVDYELADGTNQSNNDLFVHRRRAYQYDYFTACLPFQQKGAAVTLPTGTVTLNSDWLSDGDFPSFVDSSGNIVDNANVEGNPQTLPYTTSHIKMDTTPVAFDPNGSLLVEPTLLHDLRTAAIVQQWLERNAVAGTRYPEWIRAHYGVDIEDYRIDRPEYIGGSKAPIVISEVLNSVGPIEYYDSTAERPEVTGEPQGSMAGHGVSYGRNDNAIRYSCKEHGWIIGITSVMPETLYYQGIDRHWLHNEPEDFCIPSLAHLSEQPVFNQELYADHTQPNGTFGYLPIYSHMRFRNGRIAGDFTTSLDYWHVGRKFSSAPALNSDFIECAEEDCERIFAVLGEDPLWIKMNYSIRAERPLPVYGKPGVMTI